MNREILFRGKRIDNGEWAESDGIIRACNGAYRLDTIAGWVDVAPSTVGQYTGLTDKNGTKIFEGDIIKWPEKEWGCSFVEAVTWELDILSARQNQWPEFCEIIGNISDNPKLLEDDYNE